MDNPHLAKFCNVPEKVMINIVAALVIRRIRKSRLAIIPADYHDEVRVTQIIRRLAKCDPLAAWEYSTYTSNKIICISCGKVTTTSDLTYNTYIKYCPSCMSIDQIVNSTREVVSSLPDYTMQFGLLTLDQQAKIFERLLDILE